MATVVVLRSGDPLVVRKLESLATELALELLVDVDDQALEDTGRAPAVIVVDLDRPEALEDVAHWRERWPEALVAGYLGVPERERWLAAERAGCDLVANRGALTGALRKKLAGATTFGRRRIPLLDAADVAGRLGLVHRDPASEVGPLAVYHLKGKLHAVEDRCPHAGATLSDGELEGPVLTCPRHGSQFDVRDGTRLRGPADVELRTFPLVEEGGIVYLVLGPEAG